MEKSFDWAALLLPFSPELKLNRESFCSLAQAVTFVI